MNKIQWTLYSFIFLNLLLLFQKKLVKMKYSVILVIFIFFCFCWWQPCFFMTSKNCESKNILVLEILAFNCTKNSEKSKLVQKSHLFKVLSDFSQVRLLILSILSFVFVVLIASDFGLVLFFWKLMQRSLASSKFSA